MNWLAYYQAYRLVGQSRFAEAIALDVEQKFVNYTWAYYRLGMYESSYRQENTRSDFHTLFANAISTTNMGLNDESRFYLKEIKKKYPIQQHSLIIPLATYATKEAFYLVEPRKKQDADLYFALLNQLDPHKAKKEMEMWRFSFKQRKHRDLILLQANIHAMDAVKKLNALNHYLSNYHLSPLTLKDAQKDLNLNNLKAGVLCKKYKKPYPLVSVIVPAYNVQYRIRSCIDSLIHQTYQNIEIIIVNDASTDQTYHEIEQLKLQYPQVQVIHLPVNVGPFVAKNIGAYMARGEFITTQDADDWAHPQRIYNQAMPLLKDTKLIATTCQWVRLSDDGQFYARQVFPFTRFNPSSPMFRKKEVIKETGLWDLTRLAADTEFIARLKLVFGRKRVLSLKQPLVLGAHRKNSLMTDSKTGNWDHRISPTRLAYWESWGQWHIDQLRQGNQLKMPSMQDYQPQYIIPKEILNEAELLERLKKDFVLY